MSESIHRPLDFVVIGAEKAGTSFLVEQLRADPSVYLPPHEVRYFRDPFFGPEARLHEEIGALPEASLVGIKHPGYLGRPEVPERIHRHRADIKLLVTLRDPVERCISSYFHYLRYGQIPPIHPEKGLARVLDDPGASPKYADILGFGFYHRHLSRYREWFAPEQIFVVEYEGLVGESALVNRALAFLGLGHRQPELQKVVNRGDYGWVSSLLSHFRARLDWTYDDQMNLTRDPAQKAKPLSREEVLAMLDRIREILRTDADYSGISEGLRERLRETYREDVERLVADGLLAPRRWPNYPAPGETAP